MKYKYDLKSKKSDIDEPKINKSAMGKMEWRFELIRMLEIIAIFLGLNIN